MHNNNNAVFVVCHWANGPRVGPGLGLKYENCVAGLDILFAGRAGPEPHNSICMPGLHNCCRPGPSLGLKSYLRAGPVPKLQSPSVHPSDHAVPAQDGQGGGGSVGVGPV